MRITALVLVGLIAASHVLIGYCEMFAWENRGPQVFSSFADDSFSDTATLTLAANQGLYNLFLAAGLVWSLLIADRKWQADIATFFLLCVGVAGAFGAVTASFSILYVQTVPSVLALVLLHMPPRSET